MRDFFCKCNEKCFSFGSLKLNIPDDVVLTLGHVVNSINIKKYKYYH